MPLFCYRYRPRYTGKYWKLYVLRTAELMLMKKHQVSPPLEIENGTWKTNAP
jgi:hypothetical protein